jgi:hypothetical protein
VELAGGGERLEAPLEVDAGKILACHDCVLNSELLENSEGGRRRCSVPRHRYHDALRRLPATLLVLCGYLRLHDNLSHFDAVQIGTLAQYRTDLSRIVNGKNIRLSAVSASDFSMAAHSGVDGSENGRILSKIFRKGLGFCQQSRRA